MLIQDRYYVGSKSYIIFGLRHFCILIIGVVEDVSLTVGSMAKPAVRLSNSCASFVPIPAICCSEFAGGFCHFPTLATVAVN